MDQNSLISVGMPTYNRPQGLRKSLGNVLKQTYKNLQIIISDNCSEQVEEIAQIIEEFKERDPRITYHRQSENIGSVRNLHFVLEQATGDYFLWVADDDFIEDTYIESLWRQFQQRPEISISMSAYVQYDIMTVPHIEVNMTQYLKDISAGTSYERVSRYLRQSDHYGKSRLMWGMFKTVEMKSAFKFCLDKRMFKDTMAIWPEIPAELQLLVMGDAFVGDEILFHVTLLPTSEGKKILGQRNKLVEVQQRASHSLRQIVENANFSPFQKMFLKAVILKNQIVNTVSIVGYYAIEAKMPHFARLIKKLWYKFT